MLLSNLITLHCMTSPRVLMVVMVWSCQWCAVYVLVEFKIADSRDNGIEIQCDPG